MPYRLESRAGCLACRQNKRGRLSETAPARTLTRTWGAAAPGDADSPFALIGLMFPIKAPTGNHRVCSVLDPGTVLGHSQAMAARRSGVGSGAHRGCLLSRVAA